MSLARASGWCLGLLAAIVLCSAARGQDATTPAEPAADESPVAALQAQIEPLREQLASLREQLTAATDLEADVRTQIEEQLQTAETSLTEAEEALANTVNYTERSSQVQEEGDELQSRKDTLAAQVLEQPVVPEDLTLPQLERTAAELQQTLDELKSGEKPPDDPQARAARRKVLRDLLVSLPQEITTLSQTPAVPDGELPLLTQARQLATRCRKLRSEAMLLAVRAELSLYDAEDAFNVAQLRRDVLGLEITRNQKEIDAYQQRIRRQRRELASERVREARNALSPPDGPPPPQLVRNIIDGPLTLGDEQLQGALQLALEEVEVRSDRELLMRQLESVEEELQQVRTWLEQAETRVETTGPTQALGFRLRQQRQRLPNRAQVRRRKDKRLETIEAAQNSFLDYTEQLNAWTDVEAVVDAILATSDAPRAEAARAELRSAVLQAVQQRKAFLAELVGAYEDFTKTLDDLDVAESSLIEETGEFIDFMDERILWIRSHKPLFSIGGTQPFLETFRDDNVTLWLLLDGTVFLDVWQALISDVRHHYITWSAVLLVFIVLLVRGSALRKRMRELARIAQGRITTTMKPTLETWLISIVIAIPWPALILFLAWRLRADSTTSTELSSLAAGLVHLGLGFFILEFFRQVCRPNGLADAHFEWPDRCVILLRRTFRGLILFALPAGAVVVLLHAHESGAGNETDAFEMLAFVITMLILLFFLHRLLRPSTGVLREWAARQEDGWGRRLQYPFYFLSVGLMALLTVLAVMGYYYTAQRLLEKVQITLWLVIGVLFLRALLYRALTLHRRRLALEQLRQRRAAIEEAAAAESETTASSVPDVAAESQTDLGHVSRQTQKLLNTTLVIFGLAVVWGVWSDVLPALKYLDNEEEGFWPRTTTALVETTDAEGETDYVEQTVVESITWVDLAAAVLIAMLTITATKNVPGLLEISILQRLPLDASARYATTTITRYLIVLLGIVLVSHEIGIGWGQVQWLAAALTVGLGFGLQEIFANFVSGIIILFEQPVRVGDIVTIDNVSGVVNRIRMRSTTITDWDRREYIVPNKEFITGRLLNWTLSNTTNRVTINVGVAYGSDTNRVYDIITRIAAEHPHVLDDPAPIITFETFGDSSLNFVLRAYIPNLDHRLSTIGELNSAIHNELARAGIEIPFPQRDLHLKSWPAELDRVLPQPEPQYQHDG